ncbi:radical SAM protein [Neisseriaceae bacterium PsAf]|nr:radical SAM protein [Neisseriaceae bacterium PsAf]
MNLETKYRIVEIFESMQGEGYNTGMLAIFLRFGKCNLACAWCDTPYQKFSILTARDILQKITQYQAKNIIITGGEPTIQPDIQTLITELKQLHYYLAIETNGLKPIPKGIDYIATSPKKAYQAIYHTKGITEADEVRLVVDGDMFEFCQMIESKIQAKNYYLSPCEINGQMNIQETMQQLGKLNSRTNNPIHWNLSLQTHKLIGIR